METYWIKLTWSDFTSSLFKNKCESLADAEQWFRQVVKARSRHRHTGDHCVLAKIENEKGTYKTQASYHAKTIKTTKVESDPSLWTEEEEHTDCSGNAS